MMCFPSCGARAAPPPRWSWCSWCSWCSLVAVLLVGAGAAASAWAAAWTLDDLMGQLGKVRSGEARFVEHRKVQQLERTLVYSGRLSFAAPDTLVRETLQPRPEKMIAEGRNLTLTLGGRTRTMALDASPEAMAMVEAIRGTLSGDRAAVERHFEATLEGGSERWTLDLVPRDVRLRGQIPRVTMQGRRAQLREVRILMGDGDESIMKIEPVTAPASAP